MSWKQVDKHIETAVFLKSDQEYYKKWIREVKKRMPGITGLQIISTIHKPMRDPLYDITYRICLSK